MTNKQKQINRLGFYKLIFLTTLTILFVIFLVYYSLFHIFISRASAQTTPQLLAPPYGIGLFIYNPNEDIKNGISQQYTSTYKDQTAGAAYYYLYPNASTISYDTTKKTWIITSVPALKDVVTAYETWFTKNKTRIIPLFNFDNSAICQLEGATSADLTKLSATLVSQITTARANGISFDVEGSCANKHSTHPTPLLSRGKKVEELMKNISSALPAEDFLAIFSAKAAFSGKAAAPSNQWSFWPALNRVTNKQCSQTSPCQAGFWIPSEYDQAPTAGISNNNTPTEYAKTVTKFIANQLYITSLKQSTFYIQPAFAASASDANSSTYLSYCGSNKDPDPSKDSCILKPQNITQDQANKKMLHSSYHWGLQTTITSTNIVKTFNNNTYNFFSYSLSGAAQCQFLCMGLSAMHAIADPTHRPSQVCNVNTSYTPKLIPPQFNLPPLIKNHIIGIALYQINQPDILKKACATPTPEKICPPTIADPETISTTSWNLSQNWFMNFINFLNNGTTYTTPTLCS